MPTCGATRDPASTVIGKFARPVMDSFDDAVLSFLDANRGELELGNNLSGLTIIHDVSTASRRIVTLQQTYDGIPVLDRTIKV